MTDIIIDPRATEVPEQKTGPGPAPRLPASTRRTIRWSVWSGVPLVVLFPAGFLLAGLLPLPAPDTSQEELVALYGDHPTRMRAGIALVMLSSVFLATWGAGVAALTRDADGRSSVLTFAQLATLATATTLIVLDALLFAVAAFRPGEIAPDVTQAFSDMAFLALTFDWAPFAAWGACIGIAILRDHRPTAPYPRWAGYLSLWSAFIFVPAILVVFFDNGPFAWSGLFCFYLPGALFFIWFIILSVLTHRAVRD